MAEKSAELTTIEERIAQAKELFGRGSRNYLVKLFNDAADDLSQVCNTYEEVYGQLSDELGMPYLLYAKTLIALAQDENKVLSVPNEQEDDDEDGEDEEEGDDAEENAEKESNCEEADVKMNENEVKESEKKSDEAVTNGSAKAEADTSEANGKRDGDHAKGETGDEKVESTEASNEPGTSNGVTSTDVNEENEEDDEAAANLQVAWEILELAVKIFERQGESALANLAEALNELAGISFENSHFDAAISDFKKSLEIHMKVPDDNRRIVAEIQYKIGLAYLMQNGFDDCIQHLRKASELIDEEIEEQKQKENQTENQKQNIKDLEDTKQDILLKIAEVEDAKTQSIEEVRKELTKLISTDPNVADGEGTSSSSLKADSTAVSTSSVSSSSLPTSAEKSKPNDISHLIKRKKPDVASANDIESSPAKRAAI